MSSSSSLLRLWSTIPTASSLRFPTQQTFSHSLPGNQVDYPSTVWLQVDVIWILLYFAVLWLKIKRCFLLGRKAMTNLDSILKSRDISLPTKVCLVKAVVFPVVMYGCERGYKGSWASKNWCFWTVELEKTLESPLGYKEIQSVHPKGNQPRIFIGRTDAEAETPILWPPGAKNWLIWKHPDAGKDRRREEKRMTEDEMVGWHHRLDGHEFE